MPSDQEAELIAAAKSGDRRAFDELVRSTYRRIYTLAFRLTGNEEDASDVVQDAYVRAYRGLRRFRGESQFSTWIYRITSNCASTHLRKRARDRHDQLEDNAPVVDDNPDSDPQLRAEAAATRSDVDRALERLPHRLRSVVVLRDIYDFSHRQIADELGISESAAKVRLHRARRRLVDLLHRGDSGQEGSDPHEEVTNVG